MSLLALVAEDLANHNIPHALVGGMALAAHGVARGTLDADVLVVESAVLDQQTWTRVRASGAKIDVRRGDADDPFVAVIRIAAQDNSLVDVLVGRSAWQRELIGRAIPVSLPMANIPVVTPADLVLLKVYAGGPQDQADVQRLLASPARGAIVAEVDSRIAALPETCRQDWQRIRSASR